MIYPSQKKKASPLNSITKFREGNKIQGLNVEIGVLHDISIYINI